MSEFSNINRYDVGILTAFSLIFSWFCAQFFWFTLDDAYITLRYSKHLAEGSGIVWNIGADPVEGYTSFLWMVIGTIPHIFNLPPVMFMKLFGLGSTILSLVLFLAYGRYRTVDRWLLAVGTAQIAVSPAIAVLSIQGMETATAMLIVLLISIAAIEVIHEYCTEWAVVMNLTLIIGMLIRPDLVVFGLLLEVGIAGLLYRQNRVSEIKYLVAIGFLLVFVPGIVYMLSRYWYFGYLLPNPFYIKSGLSMKGPIMIFKFVMLIIGPVLFVTLTGGVLFERTRESLVKMSPIFLAVIGFLSLYLFITPIQGFLYRFQAPVLPAILLICLLSLNNSGLEFVGSNLSSKSVVQVLMIILLLSGLFVYPLFTAPIAMSETEKRTQGDRVVMGQALGSMENDYKMLVTEAGAIPYYSEWTAIDELGLNSERIAHSGLDQKFLTDYEPDLIQLLISGQEGAIRTKSPEIASFLNNNSYKLVAVVHKQNADGTNIVPNMFHVYFVNTESDGYHNIACTLISQDLEYGDRSIIIQQTSVNVQYSNITSSDCSNYHSTSEDNYILK